jgi:enoyl-[acyl-carrier protein] reductase II
VLRTAICDLFGIKHPIIQGGMVHVSTAELVLAVSNDSTLGIIGCGFYQPDWVRQRIRLTKQKTHQPFGISIPLISPYAKEVIEIILQEKVPIIAIGADNPEPYIPRFKQAGMKIVSVVASLNNFKKRG